MSNLLNDTYGEDAIFNTRPRTDIPHDDGMMDEFVSDETPVLENTPVNDRLDAIEAALDELLSILRPLGPFLEQLPMLAAQVGPLMEGLEKSPVLKFLGINMGTQK